jgi:SanA protein
MMCRWQNGGVLLRKMVMFRVLIALVLLGLAGVAFVGVTNWWMVRQGRGKIARGIATVPARDVAVVLGTSPTLRGNPNQFFVGRMDTAAELYRTGKVKHLLVSGDNGSRGYDEPTAMRDALMKRGVPEGAITLDYAGFRTLDTMARAHAVFGLTQCTVVTDDFHLARSIYLARAHGIDAIGCSSPRIPWEWSKKTRMREIASRTAAWLDVWVLRTKPRYYGPKVEIRVASVREG